MVPSSAQAAATPPTIPPNASLDFEIELLSFTDRDDVLRDGSLMKKVLRKNADDWKTPNKRCDVRLTVRVGGAAAVDVDWPEIKDGDAPPEVDGARLPWVLRDGLHDMKKGELASFVVTETGVDYELEVVSWIENDLLNGAGRPQPIPATPVAASAEAWCRWMPHRVS